MTSNDKTPGPGRKDDAGKRRWSLVPWNALTTVLDVLEIGAKKYAPDNWRKVPDATDRYWNAAMRHLLSWKEGEKTDPESGLSHLAHGACNMLFLLALEGKEKRPELKFDFPANATNAKEKAQEGNALGLTMEKGGEASHRARAAVDISEICVCGHARGSHFKVTDSCGCIIDNERCPCASFSKAPVTPCCHADFVSPQAAREAVERARAPLQLELVRAADIHRVDMQNARESNRMICQRVLDLLDDAFGEYYHGTGATTVLEIRTLLRKWTARLEGKS
jgi:hypothetical protein